jgi:predicted ATPase
MLAVENLHWIDPTSEDFFTSLVERVAGARLILLLTYRPGYRPPWIEKSFATQIVLPPLSAEASRRMLEAVLPTATLSEALVQQILAKAQGNPFFLEEIVQALIDQGVLGGPDVGGTTGWTPLPTKPLPDIQIPPTVQGVLAARIDRLAPEEKALLQSLAVIGTSISAPLIRQVVDEPDAELRERLSHLQAAEFLYERPAGAELGYVLKHVLTRDVAYASLPVELRRAMHERTAQAIETLYPDRLEEHYGELAHHYRHSGNAEKAVCYLQRAGQQALQRSAYPEAIGLLTTGLEVLTTLPETPDRSEQELDLQMPLGLALVATKGYTAPEVGQVYARACELCQQVGDTTQLFKALWGLRSFSFVRGEYQRARELEEQCLRLAQRVQDPALLLGAHRALGATLLMCGELTPAQAHFEQGIALYDPQQHSALAVVYGQDQGVDHLRYAARTLWLLGYPDQALQRMHEAVTLARTLAHPLSLALALFHMASVRRQRREAPETQEWAEAAIALSREQGFPYWLASATGLRGWARAKQGEPEPWIAQMRQSVAAPQALARGSEQGRPTALAYLAEVYLDIGQAEEGLGVLAKALAFVDKNGERWWEAELHRLKGELLLVRAAEPHAEAEACFQHALDVARRQQAKSLELRAATSLARLWQQQGKPHEARQLLAEVYGWFTEGFDTADLKEAKALLEALSE